MDHMRDQDFWRQISEKNCSIHIWSNFGPQDAGEFYTVVCLMVHIIWKAFCFKQGPTWVLLAFIFVLYWQYSAVSSTNMHALSPPDSQHFHLAQSHQPLPIHWCYVSGQHQCLMGNQTLELLLLLSLIQTNMPIICDYRLLCSSGTLHNIYW